MFPFTEAFAFITLCKQEQNVNYKGKHIPANKMSIYRLTASNRDDKGHFANSAFLLSLAHRSAHCAHKAPPHPRGSAPSTLMTALQSLTPMARS